jgi:hypothetical protein
MYVRFGHLLASLAAGVAQGRLAPILRHEASLPNMESAKNKMSRNQSLWRQMHLLTRINRVTVEREGGVDEKYTCIKEVQRNVTEVLFSNEGNGVGFFSLC